MGIFQIYLNGALTLHAIYALKDPNETVSIYSPSGDTDILILAVALLSSDKERVKIIDKKEIYTLSDIDCELESSLLGFHAFTGNDYCSSFFQKGKKTC